MESVDQRIEQLERELQRLRRWLLSLVIMVTVAFIIGATKSDRDDLQARSLTIVDENGKARITAKTQPFGGASVEFLDDKFGTQRVFVGIQPGGRGELSLLDMPFAPRFSAWADPKGQTRVGVWSDHKEQFFVATDPEKGAGMGLAYDDGAAKFWAAVLANGSASVGISDGGGNLAWGESAKK